MGELAQQQTERQAELWARVACELVAALRGRRSRAQLSRQLGYRTNTVSDWEAGRRAPTAELLLDVCARLGVDVLAAFDRFHAPTAKLVRGEAGFELARWLDALRGQTPVRPIAERAQLSRHAVARWLRGQTRPRLPEFLQLVEAITARASDLVDALVGIERLPTLLDQHRRRAAARRLAFEHPESEALLRMMETRGYGKLAHHRPGVLAEALGIAPEREQRVLAALEGAGVVVHAGERYQRLTPLTVDTSAEPAAINRLKAHWCRVALARMQAPREEDWLGYNLMSLSQADLQRARSILRDAYRELRTLAAASEPVERAALLNLQLVTFPEIAPDDAPQ